MKIRPTEPERADTRSPRLIVLGLEPGARLRADVERTLGEIRPGLNFSTPIVGGKTRCLSASDALISPARPAAHLVCPMSDLTDPTAHEPFSAPASREDLREALNLGEVSRRGTSPVGLDVPHARRIDARLLVGPMKCPDLTLESSARSVPSPVRHSKPPAPLMTA